MANQVQRVAHARTYTRSDFTALRAFVQHVAPATIARLYFTEDEDGHEPTPGWVQSYLRRMQAELVELAIEHGSPVLADNLKASARAHGSARLTSISLKKVEEAASLAVARPSAAHGVGMWFRPLVAHRLKSDGVVTLGELIDFCNRRGGSWWRAAPRIGVGRARHIVAWPRHQEDAIGRRVDEDVDPADPFAGPATALVEVDGSSRAPAPLERMAVSRVISGIDGTNRAVAFPYISARHDLDAVRSYLYRFRQQPKTLRAYTNELERFLLWSLKVRQKPLSSLLVDDCEAYKDFLAAPDPAFVGPRAPRVIGRWKPFASAELTAESQKCAVRALRSAFAWLVNVRDLAGNPWAAVTNPVVVEREAKLRAERAIFASLWTRVRDFIDGQCDSDGGSYWRAVRVALLLGGDSGLRREQFALAQRANMSPTTFGDPDAPVWQLTVVGKRNTERTVPVSPATVEALAAQWRDRELDFKATEIGPPLKPLFIPGTTRAKLKYRETLDLPYHPGRSTTWSGERCDVLSPGCRVSLPVRWHFWRALRHMHFAIPSVPRPLQMTSPWTLCNACSATPRCRPDQSMFRQRNSA